MTISLEGGALNGVSKAVELLRGKRVDVGRIVVRALASFYPGFQLSTRSRVGFEIFDINQDGTDDLLSATGGFGSRVEVYFGKGDGTFAFQRSYGTGAVGFFRLHDMNSDGLMDIVSLDGRGGGNVSIVLGAPDGTFLDTSHDLAMERGPGLILVRDLNRDDVADVITANSGSLDLLVSLGNGDGSLKLHQRVALGKTVRLVLLSTGSPSLYR